VTLLPNVVAQAGGAGFGPATIAWFVAILAIMYFMMIRPQQKQLREHRSLLASLKKGDEVVTQGGLLGRIYAVTDKTVTLEVANGVRVRVLKTMIQAKGSISDEAVSPTAEKKEER
jgi:preprotein translocase subunit YajC